MTLYSEHIFDDVQKTKNRFDEYYKDNISRITLILVFVLHVCIKNYVQN